MPVQVSYKKQFVVMLFLLITFLIAVEIIVNIWLYYFYQCDFEDNEMFNKLNSEIKRKLCLENIGYGFSNQKLHVAEGTWDPESPRHGSLDENLVYINSHGFRNPEFTNQKPLNTYRIFAVGGSTTFGVGVFDNQTIPFYLQKLYNETDLGFNVEVINTGWPREWSNTETYKIKNQFIQLEPDLFIIFDGWNDANREVLGNQYASASLWKERWIEICDLGKNYNFDTIIAIQPTVGAGNKILTQEELRNYMKPWQTDLLEVYPSYAEQLNELKNHCSVISDLRNIFDHISEPIYFDQIHVGEKGNRIIAEKFYRLSLPLVLEHKSRDLKEDYEAPTFGEIDSRLISNDFDTFTNEFSKTLKELVLPYKTPRVFSLTFSE